MITKNKLLQTIKSWNPELDSVKVLKDVLNQYTEDDIWSDEKLLSSFWADKYTEFSYSDVSEFFCVVAVDAAGYCIFGDCTEIRHVSDLEAEFKTWIKEQEAKNKYIKVR